MSTPISSSTKSNGNAATLLTILVMGILGVLIIPLPPLLLDLLIAASMAASLVVLLLALRIRDALELSVFPSLLLIVTLLRLALNVATTRLILMHGGEGQGSAGHIVDAFGRFAVAGSALIGAVVFVILMVINFVVITKGSGRIAEVAARFTLDALPGKQMSIDADLGAGLINEEVAKQRRKRLEQETEFFGAMDGAAKFVRGDAIAGIAVTGVNIVGGLVAGMLRDGFTIQKAIETYTILTIGDGLVSQIPALLVSTAAGLVVTRAGTSGDLGDAFKGQLLQHPAALSGAAVVLAGLGLVPGMPLPVFALLAGGLVVAAQRGKKMNAHAPATPKPEKKTSEDKPQDALVVDALAVEMAVNMVALIDGPSAELPRRVTALRKQIATELGVLLPPIHLRDELKLNPGEYRLLLRGVEVARGNVHVDRLMVLDPA
ncbi:MAG TPA: flagellar biosynthesis protein FlhA, partial [Myxococcota bacterium]